MFLGPLSSIFQKMFFFHKSQPVYQVMSETVTLENKVQALDVVLSSHQLLSGCHLTMLLNSAADDSILSAAANYNMGILSAVAN